VIEDVVKRPIDFEIVDYKNIYINVLCLDKEKDKEEMIIENIKKYEYIPTTEFEKSVDLNMVRYMFIEGEKKGVKSFVGYDMEGNLKEFDLLEGHVMVGGASRWGKSSFLNVFITNTMLTYTPNEVMFLGCDYKKSDVYYFRKYKHFRGMSTNKKEFIEQVNALEKEMELRSKILEEANCRNVINYNKKNDKKLSYIVYVIDELVQLVSDKECSLMLHRLMSKCASYGIYVILASQDFTKDTIGKCKMNCSQVVGFHTQDETDSTTLIGKGYDLQDINVKGRCKIKNSEGIVETQIMYIDEDTIDRLLRPYLKE
jgi:DNA segregation ATPase FtsK/SpoIIIE-like protein